MTMRFIGFLMMCAGCFWIGFDSTNPKLPLASLQRNDGNVTANSEGDTYVGYSAGHNAAEENTFVNLREVR